MTGLSLTLGELQAPGRTAAEFEPVTTFGEALGETFRQTLEENPAEQLRRMGELERALEEERRLSQEEGREYVRRAGLERHLAVPEQGFSRRALDILIARKRSELNRQEILSRAEPSWGLTAAQLGVALGGSLLDPINVASGFVPVVGQMRYLQWLGRAGGPLGRVGVRAGVGAVEGAVGAALIEPIIATAKHREQADYDMTDSLFNIAIGAGIGGTLQPLAGAVADAVRGTRGIEQPWATALRDAERARADAAAAPLTGVLGGDTAVRVGQAYVPAVWRLVEQDEVEATLELAEHQGRDRTRQASSDQVREIAARLDPALLVESPVLDYGAPTLTRDGRVLAGNGRLSAIDLAYRQGRGGEYREAILAAAERLGFSRAEAERLRQPRLVRQLKVDVDTRRAALESNEAGAAAMSPFEQARVDAERLGDLSDLQVDPERGLDLGSDVPQVRRWLSEMPVGARAAVLDADGRLSVGGQVRLRNALLYSAFGDAPVVGRLLDSGDVELRNLARALAGAAPQVAALRAAVRAGAAFDLDVAGDLAAAAERLMRLRRDGQSVHDYLAQQQLLDADLSPEGRLWLAFFDAMVRSPLVIETAVQAYYRAVAGLGDPRQGSLLGAVEVPTRAALIERAIAEARGAETAADVVARVSPETREVAARVAIAQAVQDQEVRVEPVLFADPAAQRTLVVDVEAPRSRLADEAAARAVERLRGRAGATLDDAMRAADEAVAELAEAERGRLFALDDEDPVRAWTPVGDDSALVPRVSVDVSAPDVTGRTEVRDAAGERALRNQATGETWVLGHQGAGKLGSQARLAADWIPSMLAALDRIVAAAVPFAEAPMRGAPHQRMRAFVSDVDVGDRRVAVVIHVKPGSGRGVAGSVYALRGYALDEGGKRPPAGVSAGLQSADASRVSGGQDRMRLSSAGDLPVRLDEVRAVINRLRESGEGFVFALADEAAPSARRLRGVADVVAEVERQFGAAVTALRDSGRLNVVASAADLPLDAKGRPAPPLALGFYDPGTGMTWLNAAMLTDPETLRGVMLHEQGVHAGMPGMLGEALWGRLLDQVQAKAGAAGADAVFVRAAERARAAVERGAGTVADIPEETLAYLVQYAPRLSLIQEMFARMRSWAWQVSGGRLVDLTEADLQVMALAALRRHAAERRGDRGRLFVTLYHGTPYVWPADEGRPIGGFRWDKLGTGEGVQAFTYGHYLTMVRGIAEAQYRDRLLEQKGMKSAAVFMPDARLLSQRLSMFRRQEIMSQEAVVHLENAVGEVMNAIPVMTSRNALLGAQAAVGRAIREWVDQFAGTYDVSAYAREELLDAATAYEQGNNLSVRTVQPRVDLDEAKLYEVDGRVLRPGMLGVDRALYDLFARTHSDLGSDWTPEEALMRHVVGRGGWGSLTPEELRYIEEVPFIQAGVVQDSLPGIDEPVIAVVDVTVKPYDQAWRMHVLYRRSGEWVLSADMEPEQVGRLARLAAEAGAAVVRIDVDGEEAAGRDRAAARMAAPYVFRSRFAGNVGNRDRDYSLPLANALVERLEKQARKVLDLGPNPEGSRVTLDAMAERAHAAGLEVARELGAFAGDVAKKVFGPQARKARVFRFRDGYDPRALARPMPEPEDAGGSVYVFDLPDEVMEERFQGYREPWEAQSLTVQRAYERLWLEVFGIQIAEFGDLTSSRMSMWYERTANRMVDAVIRFLRDDLDAALDAAGGVVVPGEWTLLESLRRGDDLGLGEDQWRRVMEAAPFGGALAEVARRRGLGARAALVRLLGSDRDKLAEELVSVALWQRGMLGTKFEADGGRRAGQYNVVVFADDVITPQRRYALADDPLSGEETLQAWQQAVDRAGAYRSVLRAAAGVTDPAEQDRLMRQALPDLTAEEVQELRMALSKAHRRVSLSLRRVRRGLEAEDEVVETQDEALAAADVAAADVQAARVVAKRNAALNLAARRRAVDWVLTQWAGREHLGIESLLVGTAVGKLGARRSVGAEQQQFLGGWLGGIIHDLEAAGLWELFRDNAMEDDVARALFLIDTPAFARLPEQARRMAEIIRKYQDAARATRNRFGAWIGDLKGWIVSQARSHDMHKIRVAGFEAWSRVARDTLDLDRMFEGEPYTEEQVTRMLGNLWRDFASGLHMEYLRVDEEGGPRRPGSLARRVSQSREVHFKGPDAWLAYQRQFGVGRLSDAVLAGLEQAADQAGLLKVLGTNPQGNLQSILDAVEGSITDPVKRRDFHSARTRFDSMLASVDGRARVPGDGWTARAGANLRAWQSMAKLGGAVLSAVTDVPVFASEVNFQGRGWLTGFSEALWALRTGRKTPEQRAVLSSLGVFFDHMRASARRHEAEDDFGGRTALMMQTFFKWNGLQWWTESLSSGASLALSHSLAAVRKLGFEQLERGQRVVLETHGVDAARWELLRQAAVKLADGAEYLTPEGIDAIPDAALRSYITAVGRSASDAAVRNLRDDLKAQLRSVVLDTAARMVVQPDARTRWFLTRDLRPGTAWGEIARAVAQFKSFPVAMVQRVVGREVYGGGGLLGLAGLIVATTAFGYLALSLKEMVKGRMPRDPTRLDTWVASMLQGGALGLYGDFIFGEHSRHGNSIVEALAGPQASALGDAVGVYARAVRGDDAAAAFVRFITSNTPFANLFYTRMALDYLIVYRIQEELNPGYLRRLERRVLQENGQEFWLSPSVAAGE